MEKRVEIAFPIFDGHIKKRLNRILAVQLEDNVKSREQDSEGIYRYVRKEKDTAEIDCQLVLFGMAYQVLEDEE